MAEFERQLDRLSTTFDTKRWRGDLDCWDDEWKPKHHERNREIQDVEPAELSDEELVLEAGDLIDRLCQRLEKEGANSSTG